MKFRFEVNLRCDDLGAQVEIYFCHPAKMISIVHSYYIELAELPYRFIE